MHAPACLPACFPAAALRRAPWAPGPGRVAETPQEDPGHALWPKPRRTPLPGLLQATPGLAARSLRFHPGQHCKAPRSPTPHHAGLLTGKWVERAWGKGQLLPSGPAPLDSLHLLPARAVAASHQPFPSRLPHLVQTHPGAPGAPRQHHQPEVAALAGPRELPGALGMRARGREEVQTPGSPGLWTMRSLGWPFPSRRNLGTFFF